MFDWEEVERIIESLAVIFTQRIKKALKNEGVHIKDSQMKKRAEKWNEFISTRHAQMPVKEEDAGYVQLTIPGIFDAGVSFGDKVSGEDASENMLEIVPGNKTQEQLLAGLSIGEAADYCKYLRIPLDSLWKLKEVHVEIANILRSNPE